LNALGNIFILESIRAALQQDRPLDLHFVHKRKHPFGGNAGGPESFGNHLSTFAARHTERSVREYPEFPHESIAVHVLIDMDMRVDAFHF
jgi:hypothetical protein